MIYATKPLIYFCILIVIQQIILASATIWLANLGKAIVNKEPIWIYLSLALFSYLIVFIPPIWAMMLVQKAKFTTKNKYLLKFIENHKGATTLARDQELRNEKEVWPVAESDLIIQDFLYFCYSTLTIILMIFLTIAAIIYVIEPIIIIGYILTLIIASVFLMNSKNKVAKVANQYQILV